MSNPKPPTRGARTAALQELDRFSTADLQRWRTASEQLDELNAALYFATEPDRRRIRHKLIAALQGAPVHVHSFENWIRSVTYEHSLQPLSSAGSLTDIGGRFNTGYELDEGTLGPWPALYIAQDLETAYREKFGLTSADRVDGLTGEELALEGKISHSNVVLRGRIERVFEMTNFTSLNSFGRLLGKIKMPRQAEVLKKDLKIPAHELTMVKNGEQLFNLVTKMNWGINPQRLIATW